MPAALESPLVPVGSVLKIHPELVPLLITSTAATITSCLAYCSQLFIGLPAFALTPPNSSFSAQQPDIS